MVLAGISVEYLAVGLVALLLLWQLLILVWSMRRARQEEIPWWRR